MVSFLLRQRMPFTSSADTRLGLLFESIRRTKKIGKSLATRFGLRAFSRRAFRQMKAFPGQVAELKPAALQATAVLSGQFLRTNYSSERGFPCTSSLDDISQSQTRFLSGVLRRDYL
jgi:hypothetical protein